MRLCLLLLLIVVSAAAETAPDLQVLAELQAMVPPGWWVAPPTMRPEDDAWPLIASAHIDRVKPTAEPLRSAYQAGTSVRRPLSPEQADILAGWLADHRDALALANRTTSCAGLVRPDPSANDRWFATLRGLVDVFTVDARVHVTHNENGAAWADAATLMRITGWAAAASITGVDDLAANSTMARTYSLMSFLAREAAQETGIAAALVALSAERTMDIPELLRRQIAAPGNLKAIATGPSDGIGWANILRTQADVFDRVSAAADGVVSVEVAHPEIAVMAAQGRVFDGKDSLHLQIAWCDTITATAPSTWADLLRAMESPAGQALKVRCGAACNLFASGFDLSRLIGQTPADQEKHRRERDEMLAALKRLLAEDANPLGAVLAEMQTSLCIELIEQAFTIEAKRRLTRGALAVALVRLRDGKLPDTLAPIVAPGLLSAVPLDPFDGAPLRYDAAKGRLWSVGKDMKDDGGDAKADIMVEVTKSE